MDKPLRYTDERDRSFGVAGMAIALVLWDGEPYLASVSVDAPVGDSIHFTPAFDFNGNPRLSASLAWKELVKHFEIITAMMIGNAMCRSYIGARSSMTSSMVEQLKAEIRNNGHALCSLEDDEIELIFNKTRRYLDRVFTHSAVADMARDVADNLVQRRTLSATELFELLYNLNYL